MGHPHEDLYQTVINAVNEGDIEAMAATLADDVVWHQIGAPTLNGKEAVLATWDDLTDDVDFEATLHDVLANDDHLVGLVEARVKVGDKEITYRTAEISHVVEGRVTERWAFSDDTQAIIDFFAGLGS